MIFKTQVKWIAEKHLREVLKDYPGILAYVLRRERFDRWCQLCAERLNQLDLAGYVRSKYAVDHFVKTGACMYADHQLKKMA